MKKTIEWYDQGIIALKRLIKQHETELKGFITKLRLILKHKKVGLK